MAAKWAFRLIVAALVVWGVYRAAGKAQQDMSEQREQLQAEVDRLQQQAASAESPATELRAQLARKRKLLSASPWTAHPSWLLLAGAFYIVGLLPNALFWREAMQAMGAAPSWRRTLTAYFVGHLGKYVPGKALVVVLRTSLVSGSGTPASIAALAVFIETLTMMAVGGAVASLVLVFAFDNPAMLAAAAALVVLAGAPTLPPVFRRIVKMLKLRAANPDVEKALEGLNFRLMARGWPLIAFGWLMLGFSLWATIMALPIADLSMSQSLQMIPAMTACVALAMVLGFVSLLPGGAGVREWVVMTVLAPLAGVGAYPAFAAAIWLRIIWLVSELVISTILYGLPHRERNAVQEER